MNKTHLESLEQHRSLELDQDRLKLIISAPPGTLPRAREQRLFVSELERLEASLNAHFQHEEADGYMQDVLVKNPQLAGEIETLLTQHKAMRESLHRIAEMARAGSTVAELGEEVVALLSVLSAHERAEFGILQDHLGTDIGIAD